MWAYPPKKNHWLVFLNKDEIWALKQNDYLLENLYSPPQTDVFSKKKKKNYINGNVNKCVWVFKILFDKLCQRL